MKFIYKVSDKFDDLYNIKEYHGYMQKLYIYKYRLFRFIKGISEKYISHFFYSGMLQVFFSTAFDFNMVMFL